MLSGLCRKGSEKSELKIGLVFFGQPRYVESKLSSISHKIRLRNFSYKTIGHVWFSTENKEYTTAPWSEISKLEIPNNSIKILKKTYPGIALEIESPRVFRIDQMQRLIKEAKYKKNKLKYLEEISALPNTLSGLYSINRALSIARKLHEESPFDYLILSRYDTLIWRFPRVKDLPLDKLTISNDKGPGFPDLIFCGPPNMIFSLDSFPIFNDILKDSKNLDKFTGETFKKISFLNYFTLKDVNVIPTHIHILRSNKLSHALVFAPFKYLKNKVRIRMRLKNLISR